MDSNNMIAPTRNLHRGKAPSKKGEPEYAPAHLAYACFPHVKKLSLKKL